VHDCDVSGGYKFFDRDLCFVACQYFTNQPVNQ